MRLAPTATALTILTALAAAGCTGEDDSETDSRPGDDYSVAALLAEVPAAAGDDTLMVRTADLVAAGELAGVERPDTLDADAVLAWLGPLMGASVDDSPSPTVVHVPLADTFRPNYLREVEEYDAELGWSVLDVDVFVEQAAAPNTFLMAAGDLDEESLADNLTEVGDDIVSAGDGEDMSTDLEGRTVARPLGQPLRMALEGDRLAASPHTPYIEDWLAGPEESLADDEGLLAVAEALDAVDVVSAVLTPGGSGGSGLSEPFDAVGIGWGVEDGAALVSVAYHFASEESAASAADELAELFAEGTSLSTGAPLSDLVTFQDAGVDGPVTTVSLTMAADTPPGVVEQMLHRRDAPFVHE